MLPTAGAAVVSLHLAAISTAVAPDAYAAFVIDGVGWHGSSDQLRVSCNITLLHLPCDSPTLNAVEVVWVYLQDNSAQMRSQAPLAGV